MNYRKLTLFIALFVCMALVGRHAQAQISVNFSLDTSFHITVPSSWGSIEVVDKRTDKSKIGLVAAGQFRKEKTIVTTVPLENMLQAFGNNFVAATQKGGEQCLLVVRDLNLRFAASVPGTFYFSGDIFLGANGKYRLVAAIDTFCEFYGGVEDAGEVVSTVLSEVLLHAAKATGSGLAGPDMDKNAAVKRFDDLRMKYAVYSGAPVKEGLYENADQFLANTPSVGKLHRKDRQDHVGQHRPPIITFYFDDNGEQADRVENIFAIYNNGEWFTTNRKGKTAKMAVRNGDYYKVMSIGYIRSNNGGEGLFGITGGITFAVEYAVISSVNNHNTKGKRNGIYETRFNPETKQFMPVAKIAD